MIQKTGVIIEKRRIESARALNKMSRRCEESQIYTDHYLGKETVQNILVFRFGNGLFEPIWNHHIEHVQITVAETVGVEVGGLLRRGRGNSRYVTEPYVPVASNGSDGATRLI